MPQRAGTLFSCGSGSVLLRCARVGRNIVAKIIITTKDGEHSITLGTEPLTVGRSPANLLQIIDPASSRKHCMVKYSDGFSVIVDMGSSNGTRVNGEKITREEVLNDGDIIQVGKTLLRFVDDGSS
jgi:pSer/pThr/pTyr-binding forkhead associated (FHA) protein